MVPIQSRTSFKKSVGVLGHPGHIKEKVSTKASGRFFKKPGMVTKSGLLNLWRDPVSSETCCNWTNLS